MLKPKADNPERRVILFRDGGNQAVRIPVEFELPGKEAFIRREGDRLAVEPDRKNSLIAWLDSLPTLDEEFPEIHSDLLPLRDVEI